MFGLLILGGGVVRNPSLKDVLGIEDEIECLLLMY